MLEMDSFLDVNIKRITINYFCKMAKKSLAIGLVVSILYISVTILLLAKRIGTLDFLMGTYDSSEFNFTKQVLPRRENDSRKDFLWLGRAFENLKDVIVSNRTGKKRYIYLYTQESWFSISKVNRHFSYCLHNNCQLTKNEKFSQTADAIIFHIPYGRFRLKYPPISRKDRREHQPWIAMHHESPSNMDISLLLTDEWNHAFNWSMSYRFDADIQIPYGALTQRKQAVHKNYSAIMLKKRKMAIWFVSNCNPESKRDVLVQVLQSNGIQVDIFGRCGKGRTKETDIIDEYMFYFAFENSLCEDYITEKFFARFDCNIILVTYGGADYNNLLPKGTYINAANFKNATYLAKFLLNLAADNNRYMQMLKVKDKYSATENLELSWRYGMCELCDRVNNINKYRRTHFFLSTFLNKSQCRIPERTETGYMIA